jgi:hypothetical protein
MNRGRPIPSRHTDERRNGIRRFKLTGKGRLSRLEQHFCVAKRKHGSDVSRASETRRAASGIGVDLNRDWRRRKSGAAQGQGRRHTTQAGSQH